MVSDDKCHSSYGIDVIVLILVLMEYGLWRHLPQEGRKGTEVLILVLMEYGLWQIMAKYISNRNTVLILVLMEYGLWLLRRAIPLLKRDES